SSPTHPSRSLAPAGWNGMTFRQSRGPIGPPRTPGSSCCMTCLPWDESGRKHGLIVRSWDYLTLCALFSVGGDSLGLAERVGPPGHVVAMLAHPLFPSAPGSAAGLAWPEAGDQDHREVQKVQAHQRTGK